MKMLPRHRHVHALLASALFLGAAVVHVEADGERGSEHDATIEMISRDVFAGNERVRPRRCIEQGSTVVRDGSATDLMRRRNGSSSPFSDIAGVGNIASAATVDPALEEPPVTLQPVSLQPAASPPATSPPDCLTEDLRPR